VISFLESKKKHVKVYREFNKKIKKRERVQLSRVKEVVEEANDVNGAKRSVKEGYVNKDRFEGGGGGVNVVTKESFVEEDFVSYGYKEDDVYDLTQNISELLMANLRRYPGNLNCDCALD
jgi:dynactin complex subunit